MGYTCRQVSKSEGVAGSALQTAECEACVALGRVLGRTVVHNLGLLCQNDAQQFVRMMCYFEYSGPFCWSTCLSS